MNKKISLGAVIALLVLTVTVTVSITMVLSTRQFNQSISDLNKRQAQYAYLSDVDKAIRQHYFGTIDEEKLHAALAQGMVGGLNDPYSAYLSAADYQQRLEALTGKKTGFGFEVAQNADGQFVITHVDTDSPAQKAGIAVGSTVVKMDETPIADLSLKGLQNKLRDSESVLLTLQGADGKEAAYKVSASAIETTSVTGNLLGQIGYIRIRSFCDNTAAQFRALYDSMIADGALAFIFDLRDNRGGNVEAMSATLNYLLPSGQYGTITDGKGNQTVLSADGAHTLDFSSVTLINQHTEGEAEMFAAVLSQFAGSSTLGTTTAGRAMVQSYYPNSVDGSAIRLTTGVLHIANRTDNWESNGLTPVMTLESSSLETNIDFVPLSTDNQVMAAERLLEPAINNPDNFNSSSTEPTSTTATEETTATEDEQSEEE